MSAAGTNPAATAAPVAPAEKSEGVWHAAWRRFKADRVGLVSALIVLAFLLLVLLASLGLVAKNWQAEVGVANAPPTFIGPKPAEATGAIEAPKGPNVDLSAVDPLAPRYAEIEEAAGAAAAAVAGEPAHEVFDVEDTDDVVHVAFEDGDARVSDGADACSDFAEVVAEGHRFDLGARGHDLRDGAVAEADDGFDHVAFDVVEFAFFLGFFDDAEEFLLDGFAGGFGG